MTEELREEALRSFLVSELAENPTEDLEEGEHITDAFVIYRIATLQADSADGFGERYKYTVTNGVNLAMAFGMLELTKETLNAYYQSWMLSDDDDEDEEG